MSKPTLISIDHDEYAAKHIGWTGDRKQFFLTNPFVPAIKGNKGREFLALYLFDDKGALVEALIDDLGTRDSMDDEKAQTFLKKHLSELGSIEYGRIEVQPFQVDHFGVTFGLIPREPEEEGDDWWVEVQPGNYMAFHEPWDSGEYDT